MFDEPSHDYRPIIQAPPKPVEVPPAPLPQPSTEERPWWLRMLLYIPFLLIMGRICTLTGTNDATSIIMQLLSASVMMVIALGVLGVRRWAAVMFIVYCGWTIISGIVVTLVRFTHLDVVEASYTRDMLLLDGLFNIVLMIAIYGALGVLFALNLRYFTPAGENRYGNIPFVLMLGVLILFTATQIASARSDVQFRADAFEDSQEMLNDWLN